MTPQEIIRKIDAILVDEFELDADAIVPEAQLREDLDLDSLDGVDLVVALEKSFGIRVDGSVVEEMKTVGDIHDYVRENYSTQAQVEAAKESTAAAR
jgi:acyl carrier protein